MSIREEILELAKKARVNMTEEEIVKYEQSLIEYRKGIEIFKKMDLSEYEPASYPFEIETSDLRSDDLISNNPEGLLDKVSETKDGYIVLKGEK